MVIGTINGIKGIQSIELLDIDQRLTKAPAPQHKHCKFTIYCITCGMCFACICIMYVFTEHAQWIYNLYNSSYSLYYMWCLEINLQQVHKKTFSMRKLVAYRIWRQWWCKKEGEMGLIIRENGIVLYIAYEQHTISYIYRNVLIIGLFHFPLLLDPCFHPIYTTVRVTLVMESSLDY